MYHLFVNNHLIDDEVAIFIECTSEAYVEKFIEEIEDETYYEGAKKLIVA